MIQRRSTCLLSLMPPRRPPAPRLPAVDRSIIEAARICRRRPIVHPRVRRAGGRTERCSGRAGDMTTQDRPAASVRVARDEPVLLAIDVGATSIKAGLFRPTGDALASASRPNGPAAQPDGHPTWLIWDVDAVWRAVCAAVREVVATLPAPQQVRGVAIVSF